MAMRMVPDNSMYAGSDIAKTKPLGTSPVPYASADAAASNTSGSASSAFISPSGAVNSTAASYFTDDGGLSRQSVQVADQPRDNTAEVSRTQGGQDRARVGGSREIGT